MKPSLILSLLLLQTTLQTYRKLETRPLSFQVAPPATIVAVTSDSVAVSSGPTIRLLSQNKAEPEQTFTSKRNDPQLQAMPSLRQAVFNNDAGLFQLRSQQGDLSLSKLASDKDVPVASAFRQNILVVPSYEAKPEVLWINSLTGEKKTIIYESDTGNIEASSGVTIGPNKLYYMASRGQCDGTSGKINLYEGDESDMKIVHQFTLE